MPCTAHPKLCLYKTLPWKPQGSSNPFVAEKNQVWLCWNWFIDLLFVAVIIIIHNGLPQRTLPLCLTVGLKRLCSSHREIIDPAHLWMATGKKRLAPPFPEAGHSQKCFVRLKTFFNLLPHCLSLSSLSFDFSYSLLSLWFYKRIWQPDPKKMVETIAFHFLSQPAFCIKSYSLPQLCPLDFLACHAEHLEQEVSILLDWSLQ